MGGTVGDRKTIRYMALPEVAEYLELAVGTLNRYRAEGRLPPPDAQIGTRQVGWTRETIDAWNASRPGRGRRARSEERRVGKGRRPWRAPEQHRHNARDAQP